MKHSISNSFFKLLRYGLWPEHPCEGGFTALTDREWWAIYELAVSQTVEALVYDGVLRLEKCLLPSEDLLLHWTVRVDALERRNRQMSHMIAELGSLFQKQQVDFMLLKGHTLASCYAQPLHRNSGDIDIYFPNESDFRRMNRWIGEKGVTIKKGALYSAYYRWKRFDIEHHTKLMDLVNPASRSFLASLVEKEDTQRQAVRFGDIKLSTLSPLLTHVHTNAHILKHFIGYGVGLRQFCDMARLCFTYHDRVQGGELEMIYCELGISKWSRLLYGFLIDYLGLSESFLPFPLIKKVDSSWLSVEILRSGNFGFFENELIDDIWKVESIASRKSQTGRFVKHFLQMLMYAPAETIAFPLSKIQGMLSLKSIK